MRHEQNHFQRSLFMPLLCVLLASFTLLPASPAMASDGPSVSAQVARLYQEAAQATQAYERGRRAAAAERVRVDQLEEELADVRYELEGIRDEIGVVARAQYRSGGSLPLSVQLLLADDPDAMLSGGQVAWKAEMAVNQLMGEAEKAERRTAAVEEKAREAWERLDARTAELARIKRGIETKLESAQWTLQAQANRSAAAGQCAGAVRLSQPEPPRGPSWVAPVEHYTLSAGFNSSGTHWASRHTGQDFAVGIGTPVRTVGEGRVVSVSCGGGFGMQVVVQHVDGWYTQYAHLAAVTVDQGDWVRTGEWVGQTGTTGNSTGPHLHFEARLTPYLGSGVDPVGWLRDRGVWL
ncbi:murein hydrolase activator EnvC family protein [Streptomyces sp. NPDC054841]